MVATATTGHDAVKLASELDIDIILMDIQMETRTAGIEAAEQILRNHPSVKIIILTILEDDNLLFQAYCAGVMDYIIKTDSITQILNSIRDVYNNQLILRPKYAEKSLMSWCGSGSSKKVSCFLWIFLPNSQTANLRY